MIRARAYDARRPIMGRNREGHHMEPWGRVFSAIIGQPSAASEKSIITSDREAVAP
jgi:hypothetical protein